MHGLHIAHKSVGYSFLELKQLVLPPYCSDIKSDNVMMDSAPLYDEPLHPSSTNMKRDFSGPARKPKSRTLRPVKYFHIDFGHARMYSPTEGPPREFCGTTGYGGDGTVPEFKTGEYCDPFPVDVYRAGNLIRELLSVSLYPVARRNGSPHSQYYRELSSEQRSC